MKSVICTTFAFFSFLPLSAQHFGFETISSSVTEPESGSVTHEIKITVDSVPKKDSTLVVVVKVTNNGTAVEDEDYIGSAKVFTFVHGQAKSQIFQLKILSDTAKEEKTETIGLELRAESKNAEIVSDHHVISIKNYADPGFNKYILSTGFSFDYLNGRQETKPFFEVDLLMPDEWVIGKKAKRPLSVGLGLRFFQSRNISKTESEDIYDAVEIDNPFTMDSTQIIRHKVSDTVVTTSDNLGIQGRFFFRLPHRSAKSTRWYFVLNAEGLQKTTEEYTRSFSAFADTGYVLAADLPDDSMNFRTTQTIKTRTIFSYYGAGLFFHHTANGLDARLMVTSGFMYHPEAKNNNAFFLNYEFSVLHQKSGIRLGGESRGAFRKNDQSPNLRDITYTIYLAKSFSLEKIGNVLKDSL